MEEKQIQKKNKKLKPKLKVMFSLQVHNYSVGYLGKVFETLPDDRHLPSFPVPNGFGDCDIYMIKILTFFYFGCQDT